MGGRSVLCLLTVLVCSSRPVRLKSASLGCRTSITSTCMGKGFGMTHGRGAMPLRRSGWIFKRPIIQALSCLEPASKLMLHRRFSITQPQRPSPPIHLPALLLLLALPFPAHFLGLFLGFSCAQ
ncbi:hypothetical protein BO71DRAFT_103440 [Aspergillus ellipticus CBS 707.79]|uniref:Secreted protein n=1 Tax=Aspergillus ellipticus CBS 707.79 TaxID=1448320 RepID=A0A319CWK7_9EURO|nr:hypothetical protein BO71DRAFT_103440 [Aspergillus ellipticus CBS 707.79]